MSKICFSYLFGNKDKWIEPNINKINTDWHYVLFTDQPIKSDLYHVVKYPIDETSSRIHSRKIKTFGADNFFQANLTQVFHHDANIIVNCDLDELPEFMVMKHPFHWCAFKEIELCKKLKKDTVENLNKAKAKLLDYEWRENAGLFANGLMMRPNTFEVNSLSHDWWNHVKNFSVRDQIFLPYLLNKHNLKPAVIEWESLIGSKFLMHNHLTK